MQFGLQIHYLQVNNSQVWKNNRFMGWHENYLIRIIGPTEYSVVETVVLAFI